MGVPDLAWFALVMATGIVSVGVGDQGMGALSGALLWVGADVRRHARPRRARSAWHGLSRHVTR